MIWILVAACFVIILAVFTVVVMYFALKRRSDSVLASRYIVSRFEPDNTATKLSDMIDFHKRHKGLSKYNIE